MVGRAKNDVGTFGDTAASDDILPVIDVDDADRDNESVMLIVSMVLSVDPNMDGGGLLSTNILCVSFIEGLDVDDDWADEGEEDGDAAEEENDVTV